jgi:catechol 2,3-dioxygenase-like lactoylglutathione lyase family enzyme
MIDHTGVVVRDLTTAKEFYSRALGPIGYELLSEVSAEATGSANVAGYGVAAHVDFWLIEGTPNVPPIHIAFRAKSHAEVDNFYRAALVAGGRGNGGPGIRPQYGPNYYAAFVVDFDGQY